jgi:2-methylcitrate dehydratase PrpD
MSQTDDLKTQNSIAENLTKLCEWSVRLSIGDIPKEVLKHAALILGDNIAATISAANEPEVHAYHQQLMNSPQVAQATLLCQNGPQVSMMNAALGNGLAITWNELDDGYTKTAVHPGALSQPLILAAAQANNLSTSDMLRAVVVAYEIGTRFARTWPQTLPRLHPHGVFNAICAAAGYAALLKFNTKQFLQSITSASTMVSPGPYSHPIQGALIRNAWPAAGAWLGYFSCEMALVQIYGLPTGPYDVFEKGFVASSNPEQLGIDLGSDWTITAGYHKLYGSCQHTHASMEGLEQILTTYPHLRGGDEIQEVLIEVSKMAMNFNNAMPKSTLAAKFSIPHAVAATIVHGAQARENFLHTSMSDQKIANLRNKVVMQELQNISAWPYDRPAKVTIKLKNGEKIMQFCEAALGSSARPLDVQMVLHKIKFLSAELAPNLCDAVIALRQIIDEDQLESLKTSDWINSFFRA